MSLRHPQAFEYIIHYVYVVYMSYGIHWNSMEKKLIPIYVNNVTYLYSIYIYGDTEFFLPHLPSGNINEGNVFIPS